MFVSFVGKKHMAGYDPICWTGRLRKISDITKPVSIWISEHPFYIICVKLFPMNAIFYKNDTKSITLFKYTILQFREQKSQIVVDLIKCQVLKNICIWKILHHGYTLLHNFE